MRLSLDDNEDGKALNNMKFLPQNPILQHENADGHAHTDRQKLATATQGR